MAPPAGRRALQVFLAVVETGPAIASFFVATGVARAGGGQALEASLLALNPKVNLDLQAAWLDWLTACQSAVLKLVAIAPGLTAEQQAQAGAAAIGLVRAVVWLLPQLPQVERVMSVGVAAWQPGEEGLLQYDSQLLLLLLQGAVAG